MAGLQSFIAFRRSTKADLESLVDKLNWAAEIIPLARYFLHRLRKLHSTARPFRPIKAQHRHIEDARLMRRFLRMAREGISINNVIERHPDVITISDSCPYGMGGFCVQYGWAWRFRIPDELVGRASNNLLEYLAEVISVRVGLLNGSICRGDCTLPMGDSTSSISWLHSTSFDDETQSIYQEVSRDFAHVCIAWQIVIYGQHLAGINNIVANSLSHDHHLSIQQLTDLLSYILPSQLPQNFHINPLPPKLTCYITSLLRKLPAPKQKPKERMQSTISLGVTGSCSSNAQKWTMTPSWIRSNWIAGAKSLELLRVQYAKGSLVSIINSAWLQRQSSRPFEKWVRSSGRSNDQTHHQTREGL